MKSENRRHMGGFKRGSGFEDPRGKGGDRSRMGETKRNFVTKGLLREAPPEAGFPVCISAF